jgi:hypothetical protein
MEVLFGYWIKAYAIIIPVSVICEHDILEKKKEKKKKIKIKIKRGQLPIKRGQVIHQKFKRGQVA